MIENSRSEADFIFAHGFDADPTTQDTDRITRTWTAETTDGVTFSAASVSETFEFDGADMDVENLAIKGTVRLDRSSVRNGKFTYLANMDFAMDLLGVSTVDEVCTLMTSFGVNCVPCADGDIHCLEVEYIGVSATQSTATVVVEMETIP